jgi:WD40 repeat protein
MLLLSGHDRRVQALAYSPDGAILVSGVGDNSLRVWDPVSGELRANVLTAFPSIVDLEFSPDGRRLALATGRSYFILCNPASLRAGPLIDAVVEHGPDAKVVSITFSPDGRNVVTTGTYRSQSQAVLWDVTAFGRGRRLGDHDPRVDAMSLRDNIRLTATYAPDGRAVALGTSQGMIVFWPYPIPWEKLRRRGEPFDPVAYDRHLRRSGVAQVTVVAGGAVRRIAFSPDGTTLAAIGGNDVVLWDYQHPEEKPPAVANRRLIRGHGLAVRSLAFAPDGRALATVSRDGMLRLWDPREALELTCLDAGVGPLHSLAFAPDGMTVAVGGERRVVIWDVGGAS